MRKVLTFAAAMAVLAAACGGCDLFRGLGYLMTPDPKHTIKAEYDGLDGQRVAIIVYAPDDILYAQPRGDVEVAMFVVSALREAQQAGHLKGMTLVPVSQTARFQDRTDWHNMTVPQIGRHLSADRVLYIELDECSLREPGSVNLLRGRIDGRMKVYVVPPEGAPPPEKNPVYAGRAAVVWPADSPVAESDQSLIYVKQAALARFAKQVGRKFYTYTINPNDPDEDR